MFTVANKTWAPPSSVMGWWWKTRKFITIKVSGRLSPGDRRSTVAWLDARHNAGPTRIPLTVIRIAFDSMVYLADLKMATQEKDTHPPTIVMMIFRELCGLSRSWRVVASNLWADRLAVESNALHPSMSRHRRSAELSIHQCEKLDNISIQQIQSLSMFDGGLKGSLENPQSRHSLAAHRLLKHARRVEC